MERRGKENREKKGKETKGLGDWDADRRVKKGKASR